MKTPTLSVLLPTYKSAQHLGEAIESVCRQNFTDWELVVIDDGLEEDAKRILQDFQSKDPRIIVIKNEKNLGIQKSLNAGVKNSKGEYLARIDDDDEWIDKDKLQKQVDYLKNNTKCVLVGTNALIVREDGRELARYSMPGSDAQIRKRMLSKNCFIHPSVVVRKDAIVRAGGYDEREEVKHIEDYALWLKLGTLGEMANLSSMSVQLLIHPASLTFKNRLKQSQNMAELIRQYRNDYPNFIMASILLKFRTLGFLLIKLIPVSEKLLYKVQKIYRGY